ncbi:pilus assembly protein [Defluviimonas sp. WL0024]|uniref:Pilus assembly protein n=2 Tax=Albidovulum TaxID=205889 RepID=A0ABT3J285_9RHOB|nr:MULTISPECIES: pilus assembly protein [Defluviimonas]MCU9847802.1 pilus assembly protein [Defluviimonas sp. WL0024]MCW3781770.1 pilus assembly protein [Defluviimonas salinarum]
MAAPRGHIRAWFWRKIREEHGATATIPFMIFLPFFFLLMMSSLELGVMMARHMMLERALDLTVRDLRLGTWEQPRGRFASEKANRRVTHAAFRRAVCRHTVLLPNCETSLLVELRPVSTETWAGLQTGPTCASRSEDIVMPPSYAPGAGDEMMLIRACAKFAPVFPTTGIGIRLPTDESGTYSLVSVTALVNDPGTGG